MASPQDFIKQTADSVIKEEAKHTITIDGAVYKVVPLDAESGLDTWEFIGQIVGPSIGSGLDGMQHDSIMDGAPTTFSEALIHLSNKLGSNPGTLKALSLTLLQDLQVDGKPVEFKEHFRANYGTWLKVIKFALKENYASFFEGGWQSALIEMMGMVAPMTQGTEDTPQ